MAPQLKVFLLSPATSTAPSERDAFTRFRVAAPETIFDSKQIVDSQPFFWDDREASGAGTASAHNTNQASTTISVSNTTTGTRVRQTLRSFNYQPGKSQLVMLTGLFGTGAAGITQRIGQFNANNGFFWELAGTTLSVVVRSNVSGTPVGVTSTGTSDVIVLAASRVSGTTESFYGALMWREAG